MAQSQNNVKVLPGWSAISARHINLPSEQERSLSAKGCGTEGAANYIK